MMTAGEIEARNERQIAYWLLVLCLVVFIMLVIGGATRLTHSGLSMVEWDPLMGWIPPMGEAQWSETFAKYQQTPEFQQLNTEMDLEGFKGIFLLEYVHRVWGRLIGLFFLLPFLYFLVRGRIRRPLVPKLVTMFVLGGLQGVMGWYMVKSGLVDNPYVSQYRLTAHLLFAFAIVGYMLWVALGMLYPREDTRSSDQRGLRWLTAGIAALIVITVASGGLVAGLKAGFTYNTFPLMEGQFVPDGYGMLSPFYLNFFDNIAAVQFDHRWLAMATLIMIGYLYLMGLRHSDTSARARLGLLLLLVAVVVQVVLGVSTLLLAVPTWLAVTHQGGAMVLFAVSLFALHALRRPRLI